MFSKMYSLEKRNLDIEDKNNRGLVLQLCTLVVEDVIGCKMRKGFCLQIKFIIILHLHKEIGTKLFYWFQGMLVRMILRRLLTFLNIENNWFDFFICALNFFLYAMHLLWLGVFICLPYLYQYIGLLHCHFQEGALLSEF